MIQYDINFFGTKQGLPCTHRNERLWCETRNNLIIKASYLTSLLEDLNDKETVDP